MKFVTGFMLMMVIAAPAVTWAVPADGSITARPFPEASAGLLGDLVANDAASLEEAIGIVDVWDDAVSDWMQDASSTDAGEWEAALDDDQSVPCEPDKIRGESRRALGALLRNTPADLRGTKYRAPWFQAFPWTKSFPEAAEMSGAIYRYSRFGTVGLLLSTSPWPLWFNPGPPPSTDAGKVAVARGFLNRWRNLILVQYGLPDLVVHRVAANTNGSWSVEFRQRYEQLEVLGARVLVRGDAWGDVFAVQSSYVPDMAVDVVPSVSADEVDRILRSSTYTDFARGFYTITRGPELVAAHTAADFCSGTLMYRLWATTGVETPWSCLVDAHRGVVHGCARLDGNDVDNWAMYNFKGNHHFQQTASYSDPTNCGLGGGDPCHWISSEDGAPGDPTPGFFGIREEWPGDAIGGFDWLSSRKCFRDDATCVTTGGFAYQDPPYAWPLPPVGGDDGDYLLVYESQDNSPNPPIINDGCPGFIENHGNNAWSHWDTTAPIDNEYQPCKWLADDTSDVVEYLHHARDDWFVPLGITTTPADIVNDFPDFDVLASEPRSAVVYDWTLAGFDRKSEEHAVHFPIGTSSYNGGQFSWARARVLITPERYNDNFTAASNDFGSDDTLYHEMGHMIFQGVQGSHYDYSVPTPLGGFDPAVCMMWDGIHHESGPDLTAALLEHYRFQEGLVVDRNPNAPFEHVPDWTYNEGNTTGQGRDMQRPDGNGLDTRRPESINDFTIRRTDDPDDDLLEAEIHRSAGLIDRFYFMMGNDICDIDNDCGINGNEIVNDSCSCASGSPKCDDTVPPGPSYQRQSPRLHTIEPSSSCILHGATDNGTPETEGFQQYHFGVKSTSLDRSHLPVGELGRDRLGRLFFRMIFDAGALTFGANDALPYEFMDAFLDALMNDIGWSWPGPPEQEMVDFVRVRDSLGFWTPIGNYFQLPPAVGTQGLTAAMVDWGMDTFVQTRNTEWLFSFAPAPNVIYLTLRGCWNTKWDGDDDMDYCFGNANWTPPLIVDEPDLSGWFQPEGTPALDINDVDSTGVDANHGLWIVYRAHAGLNMGICKKQVPIAPNMQVTGSPPTRVCDWTSGPPHTTNRRPGVGHYTDALGDTHEVVVYADANDSDLLKSFEWDSATGATGADLVIPEGQCPTESQFRPEVVNHDGHVWSFWVGDQPGSNIHGLCYSRLNPSVGGWEPSRIIPFDGYLETCGIQHRVLNGPPEAVERNGVVNLAIRDTVISPNSSWVWMIQLDDDNGDGQFWECEHTEECAGGCFEDCGDSTNWEERSTWVPHTRFDAASPEIGDLATTEHLHDMAADSTAPHLRQDYTFFYNPLSGYFPGTDIEFFELGVRVRESW